MRYRIISVGRIREKYFNEGIAEYLKRLTRYCKIELVDGLEEKTNPRAGESELEQVIDREGERILALINPDELLIAFDSQGQMMNSEEFARFINDWNNSGRPRVNMIIGGSHGLSSLVKQRSDLIISMGKMTLPHQMAVFVLTEQIYRAFKIIKGEPYHK
ncbi:MAG: 23S rRNA (pseudouridine(1915)-N(3))-methyltransferase RlmH [Syntrophomonadaceae bacterium]|nr:23S rRNA (pseudouridine(1915)-N(3))-methyltransferase RlmH [Syntrophomonadaceae bacterium]